MLKMSWNKAHSEEETFSTTWKKAFDSILGVELKNSKTTLQPWFFLRVPFSSFFFHLFSVLEPSQLVSMHAEKVLAKETQLKVWAEVEEAEFPVLRYWGGFREFRL